MLYRDGKHIPTYGDIYNIAIDLIEKRGLNKGDFVDGHDIEIGSLCVIGAINVASAYVIGCGNLPYTTTISALPVALGGLLRELSGTNVAISEWNDDYSTTQEDVVSLLKLARERYRYEPLDYVGRRLEWKP